MSTAVLIVNYKAYAELAGCLASLAPHLAADDEIVVVDHESVPDRLAAAVAAAGRAVVTVARHDNRGFAAGVNLAAAHSHAPNLMLLNPDAVLEGPAVRQLEGVLAAHSDVGVAGARVLNSDGTVQATARRFPDPTTWLGGRSSWLSARFPGNWLSRRNLVGREATGLLDVDWVSGACMMTRRVVFEAAGGFDEAFFMYWEDADYCARVAAAGWRRVYVPDAVVRHAGGRSAARAPATAIRAFHRSAYRLFRKRTSGAGVLAAPLVRAGLWLRGEWRVRRAARRRAPVK